MRPGSSLTASAPSSSLLRFLKYQSEEICFFTPSRTTGCQDVRTKRGWKSPRHARHGLSNPTRRLTATPSRGAIVESSHLSLDFLRPPPQYKTPPINAPRHGSGARISGRSPTDALANSRHASTDSRPLLKRLWRPTERTEKTNLKSTDLPPLPGFLDDVGGTSLSRNKPGKAANEMKLRCTEFDSQGRVTFMDGEFKKTELIAKVLVQ